MTEVIAIHTVHYVEADVQKVALPGEFLTLSDKDFAELSALGAVKARSAESVLDHDHDGKAGGSIDELDQMTVEDLKITAALEVVNLGDAKRKPDIIDAIRAKRAGLLL